MPAYLGIEIGGTKLQLGVGNGNGLPLEELVRLDVDPAKKAAGILKSIEAAGQHLCQRHAVRAIGIGFGGPLDPTTGIVTCSHQVEGWENFPLQAWSEEQLSRPTALGNDCDLASLAEARFGAGKGSPRVFYVTVGTGVGGGLVVDGELQGRGRPAMAEIGHLRPSTEAIDPDQTVESHASGPGIVRRVVELLENSAAADPDAAALMDTCQGQMKNLSAEQIALAAGKGNQIALGAIADAVRVLGWAIAQVVTLTAPDIVVVGGGVSLMDEKLFLAPLREKLEQFVFPPLRHSCQVVPPLLAEEVVVHGALALATDQAMGSSLGSG